MKYKHEFAIGHLPKFIIGLVMVAGAIASFSTLIYNYVSDIDSAANVLFFFGAVMLLVVAGLTLSEGVEYNKEVADEPDPTDPWARRAKNERKSFIEAWGDKKIPTIEERRAEIIAMDFSEDNETIAKFKKAQEKHEQRQEKQELTSSVLDDE